MSSRSIRFRIALAFISLTLCIPSALALKVAVVNLTTTQKTLKAEVIVTAKIVDVEKNTVEAVPVANAPTKVTYQVGVLRIQDAILGVKDLTQIRVGWQLAAAPMPLVEGGLRLPQRSFPQQNIVLEAGQEGCFFLKKHPTEDFYIVVPFGRPLDKKAENYDKELGAIKSVRKILDKPMDALKAEKPGDRQAAASILLQRYAEIPEVLVRGNQPRQELIDEEESGLILKTLNEMEWTNTADPMQSLSALYSYLNLTPKDGWKQPAFNGKGDFGKIMKDAFGNWYKEDGQKFRVKRWVVDSK